MAMASAAPNGIIAATAVKRAEQHRVRHAREIVDDPEQKPFAEADEDEAVDGAVDGRHHLPADPLPARAEQAVAGGEHLRGDRLALAEQERTARRG